jgi:hypothetical protein
MDNKILLSKNFYFIGFTNFDELFNFKQKELNNITNTLYAEGEVKDVSNLLAKQFLGIDEKIDSRWCRSGKFKIIATNQIVDVEPKSGKYIALITEDFNFATKEFIEKVKPYTCGLIFKNETRSSNT